MSTVLLWCLFALGHLSDVAGFSLKPTNFSPPAKLSLAAVAEDNHGGQAPRFVILGGAGKIGTAVACHLLFRGPQDCQIVLVGRNQELGDAALQQVWKEYLAIRDKEKSDNSRDVLNDGRIQFSLVEDVWDTTDDKLRELVQSCDCLIHTAGPFLDRKPTPLLLAIEQKCPVYVDISDPVAFLETSLLQSDKAKEAGTTALLAAGAFPGMSNVLSMEAAANLDTSRARDIRFSYFTAGLGGSGPLNLFITNLGFGEAMAQFDEGELRFYTALSGRLLGQVDFFLPSDDVGFGNEAARERVGTRQVFAWPFPEAATVPTHLRARGNSFACMGTAPELWNVMLGILVRLVPRSLWRNERFSQFMADFSQPLVYLTDQVVGETHAMRIDVTGDYFGQDKTSTGVSIVQAHDSFRQCVAQSCAEFALDCMQYSAPGVQMTEQRYEGDEDRKRIISKLTTTPGTFCYTGPVAVDEIAKPTNIEQAIYEAEVEEVTIR